jgi:CheY-like chemotaxis protein
MRTLLVADDNRVSRELARDVLESAGYRIVEASNGEEALMRAAETSPDLVLLDLEMPLKDGYAVLAELKRDPRFARLPVMAVTANGMQPDRERIQAAGFDTFLIKPISTAALRKRVGELLDPSAKGEAQ